MAAKVKEKKESSGDRIDDLLAEHKGQHYGSRSGDEISIPDVISTGSVFFDEVLGGGYRNCGWIRFYAEPECGKTSIGLSWAKNWQDQYPDDGVVIIFNAEGRVTYDLVKRSGINTDKSKFRIIDSNRSDFIWNVIENLVTENPEKKKYFFLIDSTDACVRNSDVKEEKSIGEAEKIGGGATIVSAAGKRLSLLFNLMNHVLFMTSQVRDKVNTHGPAAGGKDASGGNAPKFYSSLIAEIKKPWSGTYIYENPSDTKSKIIGRIVQIVLKKTFNETTGLTVEYPVKNGHGVWREYEAMLLAQGWGFVTQKGAHFSFTDEFYKELQDNNINVDQKFHGERNLRECFDSNKDLSEYVISKVKKLL